MGVGHPSRRISLFQKAAPMVTVGDQKSKPGVADRTTGVGVYTRPGTRQWKRLADLLHHNRAGAMTSSPAAT
jgi:hypothetical protein